MIFILLLGFGNNLELHACPCLLCKNQPFRDIKAELKPFLTIFGTRQRARFHYFGDISRKIPSFFYAMKRGKGLEMALTEEEKHERLYSKNVPDLAHQKIQQNRTTKT